MNLKIITELRHLLHQYPDLSMQEDHTMEILIRFLREHTGLGIVQRESWFYAVKLGTGNGRKIAFRADMDALPISEDISLPYASCRDGISHKCGHDGHCAVLCGLALELDNTDTENTVYLIFQPGEETGQGALICKELIGEEGISEVFAFHNLPGIPEGTICYREGLTQPASEGIRIKLIGKASHASAPEKGRNPAGTLAKTVLYSQDICKRLSGNVLLCTVTGMKLGDGDFGISPGEGEICLTVRAEREDEMNLLESELLSYVSKEAEANGLSMKYEITDRFPETRNHEGSLLRVIRAAKTLELPVISMPKIWRASEDFGYYLKECAGAMFYIGAGADHPDLHTPEYDFNDRILAAGIGMFLELARAV